MALVLRGAAACWASEAAVLVAEGLADNGTLVYVSVEPPMCDVSLAQTIAIPMAVVKAAKVLAKTMKVTLDLATTLTRATMEELRRAMQFAACCNTCAAATGSG